MWTFSIGQTDGLSLSIRNTVLDVVEEAAEYWGRYLDFGGAVLDIRVNFIPLDDTVLAQAGATFVSEGGGSNIYQAGTILELQSGFDPNGVDADIDIDINSDVIRADEFFLGGLSDPNVPFSKFDLFTVVLHEIGHGLGILAFEEGPGGDVSVYELLVDTINSNLVFTGPNAVSLFGGDIPLDDGSHLSSSFLDAMNSALSNGQRLLLSPLDIAILKDSEAPVLSPTSGDDVLFGFEKESGGLVMPFGDDVISLLAGNDSYEGLSGDDAVDGGAGNDYVNGGAGDDSLFGSFGNDTMDGGADNDELFGGNGFDSLLGGSGRDTLEGDGGNDRLNGGDNNDTLLGGYGYDQLEGAGGNDYLQGASGNDTLRGAAGSDTLRGGVGADVIFGGSGADEAYGGEGNDRIRSEAGNDTVRGGDNDDRLFGSFGFDRLFGDAGADLLHGDGGNDTLIGGSGNDTIVGGFGFDSLDGGFGFDTLQGSTGNDTVTGGTGNDTFLFALGDGSDVYTDFTAGAGTDDAIEVSGFGASFDEFSEVLAAASQNGANVVINFGGGDAITLLNTNLGDLNQHDFLFA